MSRDALRTAMMGLMLTGILMFPPGSLIAQGQGQSARSGPAAPVQVKFEPDSPKTGDKVRIRFTLPDGAERAEVVWKVDGQEVQTSSYDPMRKFVELETPVKAGQKVGVDITLFDVSGDALNTLTREVEVGNAAPKLRVVSQRLDGRVYRAKIEASDPEEDPVKLTLEEGPKGMKMDAEGNIEWTLDQGVSGSFQLRVKAADDQGQVTYLMIPVTIRWK